LELRCVSNAFKLHAGMEFIRTVAFGEIPGNDHQRPCASRINQCSEVGIRLVPRLCPEPKSSEQYRSTFNEVVGGVHSEVAGGVRRRQRDMSPDVLLRLVSELNECAHTSASHRTAPVVTTLSSSDPRDARHGDRAGGQACPQTMSAVMGEGLKPLTVR
jgi:hypothetical protein